MQHSFTLPHFPGFYGTFHGDRIETCTEQDFENALEDLQTYKDNQRVTYQQADRILRKHEYLDWLSRTAKVDREELMWSYADKYLSDFIAEERDVLEAIGVIDLDLVRVSSPRYYNFETDQIICTAKFLPAFDKYVQSLKTSDEFQAYIKKQFTSGPGFISHYSNDHLAWIRSTLDHTQLSVILDFYLRHDEDLAESFGEDWWCNNSWWDFVTNQEEVTLDAFLKAHNISLAKIEDENTDESKSA